MIDPINQYGRNSQIFSGIQSAVLYGGHLKFCEQLRLLTQPAIIQFNCAVIKLGSMHLKLLGN